MGNTRIYRKMANINFDSDLGVINEGQRKMEAWKNPIMVSGEVMSGDILNVSNEVNVIETKSAYEIDVFSLVNVKRRKSIIVLDTKEYRPSETASWKKLLKMLQLSAVIHGVTLGVEKGGMHNGYFILHCKRGRLCRKAVRDRRNHISEVSGVADYARHKEIRRNRSSEKRSGVRPPHHMTSTRHATELSDCCKMRLTVNINAALDIYYISSGCGNPFHNNHPKLRTEEVVNGSSLADATTVFLRDEMRNANAPTTIMRQVIRNQSGMQYQRGFFRNRIPTNVLNAGTSADRLLSYLSSVDYMKYVALYDNLSSPNLHSVRRNYRSNNRRRMVIEGVVRDYNGELTTFAVNNDDSNGLVMQNDMETEVRLLHEQMTCSRTGKILLAVSWCTKQMSRAFHMFPEVCSWDVTMGTNAERRGMLIGCVYNSSFKSVPMTFTFMPNLRRWAFQWVARRAVPMLHSAEVTNEVQVMLFDEDENEISAFGNVPGSYANASARVCYFHRGTLKLQSLYKNLRRSHNVNG